MKLVVGLGNPGKKYEGTRHNVGFECIRSLAKQLGVSRFQAKYDAEIGETSVGMEKVLLMRPLTYMNLSGNSVRPLVDFLKLPLSDLLVICDDLALPPGKLRVRAQGSSGGQKGLQNICDRLGSLDVPRLRVGIGATPPNWDTADYVLSRFSPVEKEWFDQSIDLAVKATLCWIREGINQAMAKYNGELKPSSELKSNDKSEDRKSSDRIKREGKSRNNPSGDSPDDPTQNDQYRGNKN